MLKLHHARAAALLLALGLVACGGDDEHVEARDVSSEWVGSWGTAVYGPYPVGPVRGALRTPDSGNSGPGLVFDGDEARDQSFRMIVHPSLGGDRLRIRLSNLMGDRPVTLQPVRVALRALPALGGTIVPSTDTPVTFDGSTSVTIPPGAEVVSDPVALSFEHGDDLVVSFHVVGRSGPMTWHPTAFDTQFVSAAGSGDHTDSIGGLTMPLATIGWFFISGVDVLRPDSPGTIVALGDSLTDGAFQLPATNGRYPDALARRLQAAGVPMGVLNQGISSNTVTEISDEAFRGEPMVRRFERDVLDRPAVRSLILLGGSNDLPLGASAERVFDKLLQIGERAQAAGICVVIGTVPPRSYPRLEHDRADIEPRREALNALIRQSTRFDGIADFDAALANPLAPSWPNPLLYFLDVLHPNNAGYRAMADAVPLQALLPPPFGNCQR